MRKRLTAAFLCLCLLFTLLPATAFAEGETGSGAPQAGSALCEHHPQHDESCGYTEGTEGTPCTFVCEVCNAQDSGDTATPSDAQPGECTCETLCTEEEINADCPVCSADGAELDKVCVGAALLLAAPTLRTGEIKLFIGGQQITESGCYENKSGTWTKVDGTEPANGQFSYDADSATLTLNEAKIVNYQDVTVGGGFTYPGSVIAFSQSADVSLTIVVSQGTSNITGTGGIRVVSKAGDASLSISGPGSLEVNVDRNDSGITLIGSKNVNLNIDGADVKTLAAYYYGVDLHAGDGFKAAAVVNNGKLTAGGSGGIGIYYRWTNPSDSSTSSLTVSGNAVVDTRDSKILIASQASEVQVSAGSDGNGGIVFDGKSGTVYGDVTLQEDLEIGNDETLTIGKDASLTVPDGKTLTNNGTINVESGGKLEGTTTGNGTLKIAPTITTQPQDVEVKENETATFNVKVTGTEPLSYQWQQSTDNGQSWTDITGETNATYTIATTTMDMSGTQYRCVVKNSIDEVTSDAATLTVSPKQYAVTVQTDGNGTASASTTAAAAGTEITLTATPDSGYHFERWEVVSGTITIQNDKFIMPAEKVTVKAVFDRNSSGGGGTSYDYYTISATAGEGGSISPSGSTRVREGRDQTYTINPDDGYRISDVRVDSVSVGAVTSYTFDNVQKRHTIEAIFAKENPDTGNPFTDVHPDDWFYNDVMFVYQNGLMNGTSATTFEPNMSTTRAMIVAMLARLENVTDADSAGFTDVADSDWYATAVNWAAGVGIVSGFGDGTFQPNAAITREQMASILYRYAAYKGMDVSARATLDGYIDQPSAWAEDVMQWAVAEGLLTGVSEDRLQPQGPATRAQVAAIFERFLENIH